MPFWSIVRFILKWTAASIPAAMVIGIVAYIGATIITGHSRSKAAPEIPLAAQRITQPEKFIETETTSITRKVAQDAERQYAIVEQQGNAMDICVQAGMVAAAWLQAKNESSYQTWKQTERQACIAAGAPSN